MKHPEPRLIAISLQVCTKPDLLAQNLIILLTETILDQVNTGLVR